uniref:Uncharacterized protein n=1 Tax=viral metagenome TaxID=1070528 RepID=A0A6C0CVN6_9ZZZZ
MEQNINEELNWRDQTWRDDFFTNFTEELRLCDRENLEPNPQNRERYNSTRERCQFVLNYYLSRVGRIVNEMVNTETETPREIVQNIINRLEDIIRDHIFEGIVDQTTERVINEDFNELQVTNPMLQGNNQEWSELSLVNHFNRLWGYYMRVIQYINRENNSGNVGGRRRKKYKSRKANKSRRVNKKTRRIRKQKSRKLKK